jgi:anti-anti-sigma factor
MEPGGAAMNEVRVSVRQLPPLLIIDLSGAVTGFADGAITSAYRESADRGSRDFLLNFSGVDYVNSAGIAVIIGILFEARKANQHVMITGLTPHYQKIFNMMGLSEYAPVFDTIEAASEWAARQ